ncbi:hypothetical protein EBZ37_10345 [bacterium]|nr:hypothetical protein [bacterium]
MSAMTMNDPVYIDTSGSGQAQGFGFNMDTAPVDRDRSIYSETSVQHLLWKLYSNRSAFDRIYTVLLGDHKPMSALISLHAFVANYRYRYGDADNLASLWSTTLNSPWDALCDGTCPATASGGSLDIFDVDDDLGSRYSSSLRYPRTGSTTYSAAFWRLYYPIGPGSSLGSSNLHNTTKTGSYSYADNKMGMNRWYVYTHPSNGVTKTVTVSVPSSSYGNCNTDSLDMYVYRSGTLLNWDITENGCPSVSFTAEPGKKYVVVVQGYQIATSSYSLNVSN